MDLARLRNFGIVAHIDAGKTTVSERILYYTGVEHRMGEVHEGTATMDWMDQERERGITITSAVTACDWAGHRLQLIDTPGHVDFTIEVERSLRVLDGAVVVLDAVAGVQPQTETVLRQARRHRVPLLFLVNKMDRLGADFDAAVQSISERLSVKPLPVHLPTGAGEDFDTVIDLVTMEELRWQGEHGEELVRGPVPEAVRAGAEAARDQLCATVAETDEALADQWLAEGTLTAEVLSEAIRAATRRRELAPVLAGAALRNRGIQPLLDAIVAWLPSPLERPAVRGEAPDGRALERTPEVDAPVTALVFKIYHESFGDLHFLRVFSGILRSGDKLVVARTGRKERIGRLLRMHADAREGIDQAGPGELVAVTGLKWAQTGDTLCPQGEEIALEGMEFPEPVMRVTVEPREPGQAAELAEALVFLAREDPSLHVEVDEDTGQSLLSGMGELHLDIVLHRLRKEFKVDARTGAPQVSYREALTRKVDSEAAIETTVGEQPMTVRARLRLLPDPEAALPLQVPDEIRARAGARAPELASDALREQVGAWGFPLTGARAELLALDWQPAEAQPPEGALAGAIGRALREGLEGATELREPIMALTVRAPEDAISAVLGDLNQRAAEIEAVDAARGEVRARVPLAEMFAYSTDLRSQTQGKGEFSLTPAGYAAPTGGRRTELLARWGISEPDSGRSA